MENITYIAIEYDRDDSGRVYSRKTIIPVVRDTVYGRIFDEAPFGSVLKTKAREALKMTVEEIKSKHNRGDINVVYEGPSLREARKSLGLDSSDKPSTTPINLLGYAMSLAAKKGRENVQNRAMPGKLEKDVA